MSQTIKAGENAVVVVSAGDTNIGVSKEDMKSIVETLADQMPKFAAMASAIVDQRLKDFETKIMERFETGQDANPEAFADPDFQYLIGRSQHAYARSGDELTADVLVDLIAQRSMQTARTRLALSLNEAVEKSAYLTENEFAELSLCYIARYTRRENIRNFPMFCEHLKQNFEPFFQFISRQDSSYSYLAAQSLADVGVVAISLMDTFHQNYGGVLSLGNERPRYEELLGANFEIDYPNLTQTSIHDPGKLQVGILSKDQLKTKLATYGIEDKTEPLWAVQTFMTKEQLIDAARSHFPDIELLFDLWEKTPLHRLSLTSVGIAIAYANAKRVISDFEADLGIWIT
ncbi:LPO_1073/Vpar_1526 family protein [Rhizobium miluonense]|uniref:Uncharacterized protein n=1 Tax=Rhizobium miluonense TaxID=411945 RepID=A0ABU1SZ37_9HYPH|nr:LPO_1073/Vpar_1526 family protein [Rhizobium miluonense]MDR6904266.1 hypothetical protein [Rhizobium miluonense]